MDTESFTEFITNTSPRKILRSHMNSNDKEAIDTPLALRDARSAKEKRKSESHNPPSAKKTKGDGLRQKVLRRRSIQAQETSALDSSILVNIANNTYADVDISLDSNSSANESIILPHNTRFKSKRKGSIISSSQPENRILKSSKNDLLHTKKPLQSSKCSTTSTTSKRQEKEVPLHLDKTYDTVNSSFLESTNDSISVSSALRNKRTRGRRTTVALSQPNPTLAPIISPKKPATSKIADDSYVSLNLLDSSNESLESSILKKRSRLQKKYPKRIVTSEFAIHTNKTSTTAKKDDRLIDLLSNKSSKDKNKGIASKSNRSSLSRSLQAENEMGSDSSFETSKIEFKRNFVRRTSRTKVDLMSILNKARQNAIRNVPSIPEEDSQQDAEIGSIKPNTQPSKIQQTPELEENIDPLELSDDNDTFEHLENDNEQIMIKEKYSQPNNSKANSESQDVIQDSEISKHDFVISADDKKESISEIQNSDCVKERLDVGKHSQSNDLRLTEEVHNLTENRMSLDIFSKEQYNVEKDATIHEMQKTNDNKGIPEICEPEIDNIPGTISSIPETEDSELHSDEGIPNQITSIPETQSSNDYNEISEKQSSNEDDSSNKSTSVVSDSESEIDDEIDVFDKLLLNSTNNYGNIVSKSYHDEADVPQTLNKSSCIKEAKNISSVNDKFDINFDESTGNNDINLRLTPTPTFSQQQSPLHSPVGYDLAPNDTNTIPPPVDFQNEGEKENTPINSLEVSFSSVDSDDGDLQSQIAESIASLSDGSPINSPLQELPQSPLNVNSPLAKGGQVFAKSPYKGSVTPIKNTKLHSSVIFSNKNLSTMSQFTTPERKRKSSFVNEDNDNLIIPDEINTPNKSHQSILQQTNLNKSQLEENSASMNSAEDLKAKPSLSGFTKNAQSSLISPLQKTTNISSPRRLSTSRHFSPNDSVRNTKKIDMGTDYDSMSDLDDNTQHKNLRLDDTGLTRETKQLNLSHISHAISRADVLSENLSSVDHTMQLQLSINNSRVDSTTKVIDKSESKGKKEIRNRSVRKSTGMSQSFQKGDSLYFSPTESSKSSKYISDNIGKPLDTTDSLNTTFNKTNIKTYSKKRASQNNSIDKSFEILSSSMTISEKTFNQTNNGNLMEDDDNDSERNSNENKNVRHSKSFQIDTHQEHHYEECEKSPTNFNVSDNPEEREEYGKDSDAKQGKLNRTTNKSFNINTDTNKQLEFSRNLLAQNESDIETEKFTSDSDINENLKEKEKYVNEDSTETEFNKTKEISYSSTININRQIQNITVSETRKESDVETEFFTSDSGADDKNVEVSPEESDIETNMFTSNSNVNENLDEGKEYGNDDTMEAASLKTKEKSFSRNANISRQHQNNNKLLEAQKENDIVTEKFPSDSDLNRNSKENEYGNNEDNAEVESNTTKEMFFSENTNISKQLQNKSKLLEGRKENDIETEDFTSDSELNKNSKESEKYRSEESTEAEFSRTTSISFSSYVKNQQQVQNNSKKIETRKETDFVAEMLTVDRNFEKSPEDSENVSHDQNVIQREITTVSHHFENVSNKLSDENQDTEVSEKIAENEIERDLEAHTSNIDERIVIQKSSDITRENIETVLMPELESQESSTEVKDKSKNVQNNSIRYFETEVLPYDSEDQIVSGDISEGMGNKSYKNISSCQENEKEEITALNQISIENVTAESINGNERNISHTEKTKMIGKDIENSLEGNISNINQEINVSNSLAITDISNNGSKSVQTIFTANITEKDSNNETSKREQNSSNEFNKSVKHVSFRAHSDNETSIREQNSSNEINKSVKHVSFREYSRNETSIREQNSSNEINKSVKHVSFHEHSHNETSKREQKTSNEMNKSVKVKHLSFHTPDKNSSKNNLSSVSLQDNAAEEMDEDSDSDTSIGAQNMLNLSHVSNQDNSTHNVLNESQESTQPQKSKQDYVNMSNNNLQNLSVKKISHHNEENSIKGANSAVPINTKQMTMRDFLYNLSKKPMIIPSSNKNEIEKYTKLAEKVLKSSKIKEKSVAKIKKKSPMKTKREPEEPSSYPPMLIKSMLTHFSKLPVHKDAIKYASTINERLWENITKHLLILVTNDGKGKMNVTGKDIIKLMKRQKLITSDQHLYSLIEEHLPGEMIKELIPRCYADNVVYPQRK